MDNKVYLYTSHVSACNWLSALVQLAPGVGLSLVAQYADVERNMLTWSARKGQDLLPEGQRSTVNGQIWFRV